MKKNKLTLEERYTVALEKIAIALTMLTVTVIPYNDCDVEPYTNSRIILNRSPEEQLNWDIEDE